jgi:DNA-directed RNA polymerase subunit beta'
VIINEEDCGTSADWWQQAIKKNEEVVETLYERILGRTTSMMFTILLPEN